MSSVREVVARSAHEIPERGPLQLQAGDEVDVGERDEEWPAFVFVTAIQGSGWGPARHLSQDSGRAVVQTPYDTSELATQVGDVLEVLEEDLAGGWLRCRARGGRQGWVPIKTVEPRT